MYKCVMDEPRKRVFYCYTIKELTEKLNAHLQERVGFESFFTQNKIQNMMNGRTKMPDYLKKWRLERNGLHYGGYW